MARKFALWDRANKITSSEQLAEQKGNFFTLGFSRKKAVSKSEYRGTKVKRIPPEKLELMYARDTISFNGCNIVSSLVDSDGYILISDNDQDKKIVEEFFDDIHFEEVVHQWALHQCIYGHAWAEIAMNKNENVISALYVLDPKSMDFQRIQSKKNPALYLVDLDDFGKPKGYVQHPMDSANSLDPNEGIQFKPDEIISMPMRRIADSLYGIGLIEPQYKSAMQKMSIKDSLAEAIYHLGYPLFLQTIGDEKHPVGPKECIQAAKILEDVYNQSDITIPYYRKIQILYAQIAGMRENIDIFIDEQVTSFGIPKALITGTGEGTNRATLEQLTDVGARHIQAIHNSISRSFNNQIFTQMQSMGQIKGPMKLQFKPIKMDEKYDTVNAVINMARAGLFTPREEDEQYLRDLLDMPKLKAGEFNPRAPDAQIANEIGMKLVEDGRKRAY